MAMANEFNVAYDAGGDVLYITRRFAVAAKGTEDPFGVVWRYAGDGELISATVMDFHDYWSGHRQELATAISKNFHIPERQAEVVVDHAFDL